MRLSHPTQPWLYRSLWYLYLDMHKKSPVTCYLQPWNNDKDRSVIYEPEAEEGDIVIIPQHIVHFTRPNPVSFKKRIISFDFKL